MAIWQYTLLIIPKSHFEKAYPAFINQPVTQYRKDIFYFWTDVKADVFKIADKIDGIIPRASWSSEKHLSWKKDGQLHDNDCSIFTNNLEITDFSIRIDLRNRENVLKIIKTVVEICDENDLMLMNLKYEAFEANSKNILEDISKSNANSFLTNPIKFLESLK